MKKTLAQHLADVMSEQGEEQIWVGNPNPLHDAYKRSGGRVVHPVDRMKSVIDAARRSSLFYRGGYVRACDNTGRREILRPLFVLKRSNTQ